MMNNYKRIILLCCVVLMGSLSMYYSSGPAQSGGQAATGAPFNGQNCNACHGGGSFGTTLTMQLLDGSLNPVTTYTPGTAYTLRITAGGTSPALGFQTTAAFQGTNNNINNWGALPANTHNALLGGRNYIEQSTPLTVSVINIPWTAPSSTTTVVFYTAINRVNSSNSTSGDQVVSNSLTIATGCATIAMTPTSPPNGTQGVAYSQQLSQTGGVGTVTYALASGTMPPGVTINGTGLISGTPTTTGTYTFSVTATGSNGCSSTQSFTIVINCPTITLTPAAGNLPGGTVAAAYNQVISQTGGTGVFTYTVTAGTLPLGVTLNTNGTLSGTPLVAGTYNFTVTGTNGTCSGSAAYTLVIGCPTITVNPATLPNGTLGSAYSQTVTQSGGGTGGYTFTVTSGTLPNGLTLGTNGTLSGIPTLVGSYTFTVTATGTQSTCTGTRTYTIVISCPTITINPATIANTTSGSTVNVPFSQVGGSGTFTYTVSSGTLPPGLSIVGAALTGTVGAPGSYTFTITGTGPAPNNCTGTRTYTVVVSCPTISINPNTLPIGNISIAYNQAITQTGGTNPTTYAVTAGALPGGTVTLATNGTLSGTPNVSGTFNFTVTATDANGCTATKVYNWVISPCPPITLNPATLPNGTPGTAYNQTITQTGGTGSFDFTVSSGTLPPGLALALGGGLTGTPTTPGTYTFTVTATGGTCVGSQTYTIVIACPTITLAPGTLPADTVGQAYNQTITQTGSLGSTFTYTVSSGTLPPGITLAANGDLTGTGTTTGTYTFDVTMTDNQGCSATVTYTIDVVCPVIVIDQTTVDTAFLTVPYNETLTTTGGVAPFTYGVISGTLPAGITLSAGGVLSGTATTPGTYNVTIKVSDANGCIALHTYDIIVVDPLSVVRVDAGKASVVLLPNNVANTTTALITTSSSIKAELRVVDITGKVVYQSTANLKTGENRIDLDLHQLASGTYTLHVKPLNVAPVRFNKQ